MKKLIGHGDWPSAKSLFSALIPSLFALGTLPLAAAETQTTQAVDSLAQQCFIIQSPTNGQYLHRFHQGGTVDDGLSYRFDNISQAEASAFYFKPSRRGHFMMTDADGRFFASHLPAEVSAGRYPGEFAEWRVDAETAPSGEFSYRFHAVGLNLGLRHNYSGGGLYFFDLLNPGNNTSEASFKLVASDACSAFPEVEVNASGDFSALKGDASLPVRGLVDAHTHITSYEFMGGKMMHGKPFHRWGVTQALNDSAVIHGPNGALDLIGNLYSFNDANFRYDTRGWPDFPWWPNHEQMTHSGYYYKWIERAWLGGLRLMVTHLVENEVLCNAQKTINPASWVNPNDCNTMNSIQLQINRLKQMQEYIDVQSGGPGKGFFRLVSSPQEAREVIADGKLAVLMGIEASELFNCGIKDDCNRRQIEEQLQQVYAKGVRVLFPTHKFDNQLGGSVVEDGFINIGEVLATGHFFETQACDADTQGRPFKSGFPILGEIPVLKDILNAVGLNPQYDENMLHCNKHGLSEKGVYLVNRMIDMGMLIELDHMSAQTATSVMDIVEQRQYGGVITSHSWMTDGTQGRLHPNTLRLAKVGGFMAPYNSNANHLGGSIDRYLQLIADTPFLPGVGLGTDMSGLGAQAGPRDDAATNPLHYPFFSEFGIQFERQVSGNRVFDFNQDGMAHYGMLADHLQDVREQLGGSTYEALMNSAEAYLQMWERAEAHRDEAYINPLPTYVRIVNRASDKCMDIPGNGSDMVNGTDVILYDCERDAWDQRWSFDADKRMFSNKANPSLCLDNRGQAYNEGEIVVWECVDSDNLRWDYDGRFIRSAHDANIVADAYGRGNDAQVGQWQFHGGANQQWLLRPEMTIHRWVSLRDKRAGLCISAPEQAQSGSLVNLDNCSNRQGQKWYFDPIKGSIKLAGDAGLCLHIPGGNTQDHSQLALAPCDASNPAQAFDKDGSVFSSRMAPNQVLDASGEQAGAALILYHHHGDSNQKWKSSL
ncbi:ricin-type beta-trefoil lectin domain protein [Shewanella algae]|uniref:ricin-type beta-trefoil lectin domain protein n=1 Tax=Shewanella algae TaxID=38313 RepID=UPI003D7EC969